MYEKGCGSRSAFVMCGKPLEVRTVPTDCTQVRVAVLQHLYSSKGKKVYLSKNNVFWG